MKIPSKIIEFIENNFLMQELENEKFLNAFKDTITTELDLKHYLKEIIIRDLSKYKAVAYYSQESKQIVMDPN